MSKVRFKGLLSFWESLSTVAVEVLFIMAVKITEIEKTIKEKPTYMTVEMNDDKSSIIDSYYLYIDSYFICISKWFQARHEKLLSYWMIITPTLLERSRKIVW